MYIDTVTLFNRKVEADGDEWRATVLHNVDLNADKGYIRQRYGENCTDNAKLASFLGLFAGGFGQVVKDVYDKIKAIFEIGTAGKAEDIQNVIEDIGGIG